MAKAANCPLGVPDGAIHKVPRCSPLIGAPLLGVIERTDTLELLPCFKTTVRRPTVVREGQGRSSSPLDLDRLVQAIERALCAESGCSRAAPHRGIGEASEDGTVASPALFLVGLSSGQHALFVCRPARSKSSKLFRACARLSDEDVALIAVLLSLDRPTAGQPLEPRRIGFYPAAGDDRLGLKRGARWT